MLELGPVTAGSLSGALPADCRRYCVTEGLNGEVGARAFGGLGKSLGGSLSRLAGRVGGFIREGEAVVVVTAGAGWALAERVLVHGDARVVGLVCLDAYFTGLDTIPHPGHFGFFERAVRGDVFAVVVTTNCSGRYLEDGVKRLRPSGEIAMRRVGGELGLEAFGVVESRGPLVGVAVAGGGNLLWYQAGGLYEPSVLRALCGPWLVGELLGSRGSGLMRRRSWVRVMRLLLDVVSI